MACSVSTPCHIQLCMCPFGIGCSSKFRFRGVSIYSVPARQIAILCRAHKGDGNFTSQSLQSTCHALRLMSHDLKMMSAVCRQRWKGEATMVVMLNLCSSCETTLACKEVVVPRGSKLAAGSDIKLSRRQVLHLLKPCGCQWRIPGGLAGSYEARVNLV